MRSAGSVALVAPSKNPNLESRNPKQMETKMQRAKERKGGVLSIFSTFLTVSSFRSLFRISGFGFGSFLFLWLAASPPASSEDVVVYGGTSAGVVAAVQSARMGKSVVLIEPGHHLGGLTSGGLGMTDAGNKAVIGGLSGEFYQRVRKHYEGEPRDQKAGDGQWRFEPHVAEQVFSEMAAEAKVSTVFGERLDLQRGVVKSGTRIVTIRMESGREFPGKVFVDATYEGDLMALAGVGYTVGRESNSQYGEMLNGSQSARAKGHQFQRAVDPYVVPGDPASGLLPGIEAGLTGKDGDGDRRIQAYNFRMCLTDVPENRVPFPRPRDYDPRRYELLLRYLTPDWNDIFGNHQGMPNRKTDTNNHGAIGTDNIGMNYAYPDGGYAVRQRIFEEHVTYQQGLMWFLANDPRVPEAVRQRVSRWGLAKDEFTDSGNWPRQLYVREARRMISEYVHTEQDCRRTRLTPDSVGMGSYNMDSHNCRRYVDDKGHVRNEGDVQVNPGGAYMISYRSIRPKASECSNLLVPVCVSCSHIAYGSIRMEPVFMVLGHSAATAACMAIDGGVGVQDVIVPALQAKLLEQKQVLTYTKP
jgi:hypothetical protein